MQLYFIYIKEWKDTCVIFTLVFGDHLCTDTKNSTVIHLDNVESMTVCRPAI